MPAASLNREIDRIKKLGVGIKTETTVDKELFAQLRQEYDAVVIASGAHMPVVIPFTGHERLIKGLDFLKAVNSGLNPVVGEKVVVIGAGNAGMDVCLGAYAMGAKEVTAIDIQRPAAFKKEIDHFVKLGGSQSMMRPLEFLKPQAVYAGEVAQTKKASFTKITSIEELDALLAKNKGKKILLDFSAEWCAVCKELEKVTFSDASVQSKMGEFVLIKADVTDNTEKEKALSKKYGVFGPPAILFFGEDGKLIKSKTIIGFIEPQPFIDHLNQI